jgi:hypothetical protein
MCVFFFFNNSLGNKWFNLKISFQNIYIIVPYLTCFLTRYLRFNVFKFYHVPALGRMLGLQVNQYSHHFNYFPKFSPQYFGHSLDYHIFQLQVSFDACAHPPSILWVFTSYVASMATSAQKPMIQFATFLLPLCKMLVSMWDKNNYICLF